ncbi:hypothetical protein DM01DRAFT_1337874 [Hesseltinella vesiculosa]|uniref:Uncharacterized protein n=1 Tax=Hesseltinella vesiculosa TaxID=101127 RepID=A0A1X2GBZ4_9FUNG|nr:hypothetical protein DM01DRAFT_1337874 [Hesseltinella vesiculosa]
MALDTVQILYSKALRYFVLTRYGQAASTCVKAMNQGVQGDQQWPSLRASVLLLYFNVGATTASSEQGCSSRMAKQFHIDDKYDDIASFVSGLWKQAVLCYHGQPGLVEPSVVSAFLLVTIKANVPGVGRQVAEEWFALLPDATLDLLAGLEAQDAQVQAYTECAHIYTCRILTQTGDYDSARSFIEYNGILTDEKKKEYLNTIDQVQQNEQKEQERRKQVEQQRKEAEAAAKLLAEKKAAEAAAKELERQQQEAWAREKEANDRRQQEEKANAQHAALTPPIQQASPLQQGHTSPAVHIDQRLAVFKTWMQQLTATGSAAYVAIVLVIFALVGLLRGPRTQMSRAVKLVVAKLWQTIQMGTKVTYL